MKEATKLLINVLSQTKHAREKIIYSDQLAMRNIKQRLVKANGVHRDFHEQRAVAVFEFLSPVTDPLRSCTVSGLVLNLGRFPRNTRVVSVTGPRKNPTGSTQTD